MGEEMAVGKYNGWANYETWAVKLWLDDEEPSYRYWTETARDWHGLDDAAYGLARRLKEEVDDAMPLEEPSLYSDLLRAALGEVDWLEIAESYLEDVEPEEEDPDSTEGVDSCDVALGRDVGAEAEGPEVKRGPLNWFEPLEGQPSFGYRASGSRTQAVADGALVDVTLRADEVGFKLPVAVTRSAWAEFVEAPPGVDAQDEAGRLWDVLWMCRFYAARAENRDAWEFCFPLHNDDLPCLPPIATVKVVCGPDDEGHPCLTIMLPEEDY